MKEFINILADVVFIATFQHLPDQVGPLWPSVGNGPERRYPERHYPERCRL